MIASRSILLVAGAMVGLIGAAAPEQTSAAAAPAGVVPVSYDYRATWSPDARRLFGTGAIGIRNDGTDAASSVWIRLRANDGKRLQRLRATRGARLAALRAGGSMARLQLNAPLAPGASRTVKVRFALDVPRTNSSLGRSMGVDLFGDALPVVAIENAGGVAIRPEPDYGEGSYNPVADWRVSISVPRLMEVVLPGRQRVQRADRSNRYSTRVAVRDVAFAAGRFAERSRMVRGVTVQAFGSSTAQTALPGALRRAAHAFGSLQNWYGHYDLPALKVVVGNLPFGGTEFPGIVFSTADGPTIAHEVAHQWFYGLVGNDQYTQPWLDESLTAFTEQRLYKQYRCNPLDPLDGSQHGLSTGMAYWQHRPAQYEAVIYRGGACALMRLRQDMGVAAFDDAMRAYVASNAGKLATTNDFLLAVQAAAPAYDLAAWRRLVGLA